MGQRSLRRSSPAARESVSQRVAFIQSGWHRDIVDQSRKGFISGLGKHGFARSQIECFAVPGAFEIPLQAKLLANTGRYAAIVASGLVVDGGIYRHEFVASAVINALMQVQLETEVPVISVVLTPQSFHEHDTHRAFFRRHMVTKGEEAAAACAAAIEGLKKIRKLPAAG